MPLILLPSNPNPDYPSYFARNGDESAHFNLWDKLVAYWATSVGPTDLTLFNQSGLPDIDGILTNMTAADWVVNEKGWALDYDGSSHFINCGDIPDTEGIDSISISCWARLDNPGTTDNAFVTKDDAVNRSWSLVHLGAALSGEIRFVLKTGAGQVNSDSASLITDIGWHLYGATYNGTTMKVYIDGVRDGTGDAQTGNIFVTGEPVLIGKRGDGFGDVNGQIGDVGIWGRELLPAEWAGMFAGANPLTPKGRVVFFPSAVAAGVEIFRRRIEGY